MEFRANTTVNEISIKVVHFHIHPASTHSSLAEFLSVDFPYLPPHRRSEAFCDWATGGSTTVYLRKKNRQRLVWGEKKLSVSLFVTVFPLTLSASAADLPEHRSLTQPVESLLADQLQQLWLQALFELTGKKNTLV